jgi:hypothetical protein
MVLWWCLRPLCLPGRPGPLAYGLHAYMARRPPRSHRSGRMAESQNHRIEESQTRQSALPESAIQSTHSNCLSL